jgi:group I intron endonuclease
MIIYMVKNKLDGKKYIGQTIKTLEKRWRAHCRVESCCRYLKRAIKMYGKDNFEIKILAKCDSIDQMNHRETYYIRLFNSLAPNGYNLSTGGNNRSPSEVSRSKSSKTHKKLAAEGKNPGCFKNGSKIRLGQKRPGWTCTSSFKKGSISPIKGKKLVVVDGKRKFL